MTPLEIEILLHYYTRAVDYRDGDFTAPAVRQALDSFYELGMLRHATRKSDSGPLSYEVTERAEAYIQALCALPLPVQKWVMPPSPDALNGDNLK